MNRFADVLNQVRQRRRANHVLHHGPSLRLEFRQVGRRQAGRRLARCEQQLVPETGKLWRIAHKAVLLRHEQARTGSERSVDRRRLARARQLAAWLNIDHAAGHCVA